MRFLFSNSFVSILTLAILPVSIGCTSSPIAFRRPSSEVNQSFSQLYSKSTSEKLIAIDNGKLQLSTKDLQDLFAKTFNDLQQLGIESEIVLTDFPSFAQKPVVHIKPGSAAYFSKLARSLESNELGVNGILLLDPVDQQVRAGFRASFRGDGRLVVSIPPTILKKVAVQGHPIINHELEHVKSYTNINRGKISIASRAYISIKTPLYSGALSMLKGGGPYNAGFSMDELNAYTYEIDEYLSQFSGKNIEEINPDFSLFSHRLGAFAWFIDAGTKAIAEFKNSSNQIKVVKEIPNSLFALAGNATYVASTANFDIYFTDIDGQNEQMLQNRIQQMIGAIDLFYVSLSPAHEALDKCWLPIWSRLTEMSLDDRAHLPFKIEEINALKIKTYAIRLLIERLQQK